MLRRRYFVRVAERRPCLREVHDEVSLGRVVGQEVNDFANAATRSVAAVRVVDAPDRSCPMGGQRSDSILDAHTHILPSAISRIGREQPVCRGFVREVPARTFDLTRICCV
jgi:hypothetical protein